MGPGSSGYIIGTMVILSLISLSTIWFGFAWAKRASGIPAAIIAAGACSIYFGLVYFAPKSLNEVVATHVLLPGLYLGVYAERIGERKRLVLAGILCGLAAMLRIQLIPTIAFAAVYFCYHHWRRRIPAVLAGLSIPVLFFGLVDKITWSYPWQSCVRYYQVNLIAGHGVGSEHIDLAPRTRSS
jgi:4-amino-4-deoxy-L-arabinose transferase-like glycosyltransferase